MKKSVILFLALLLTGCTVVTQTPTVAPTQATMTEAETTQETQPTYAAIPSTEATVPTEPFEAQMDAMTTEELVGQLFLARYPGHSRAAQDLAQYHFGGYILFSADFEGESPSSISGTIQGLQDAATTPLLIAVDEEGGTVARLSGKSGFRESRFPSPRDLFDEGGIDLVLQTEQEKCDLLKSSGINVNMAPVCDITTDPNAFMYKRSLGQSAGVTGGYIRDVVTLMQDNKVGSVLKHFPGYGNNADTHIGSAVDTRTLEDLEQNDLVPFKTGIDAGCGAILVSHTVIGCLDEEYPATLSPTVIKYLREEMGFDGVIMTDDLQMDAITDVYGAGDAAVMAILAGNDLLCSSEYAVQYEAVLQAVQDGTIPMEQLKQSVSRILAWKADLGLLEINN